MLMLNTLDLLSKIGVHIPKLLEKQLYKECHQLNKTPFEIHHVPDSLGWLYIEAKGKGALAGLVIFVDFKKNETFDDPVLTLKQYPFKCRQTWDLAKDRFGDPKEREWATNLINMIVYGIIPLIAESCKDHIMKEFEQELEVL